MSTLINKVSNNTIPNMTYLCKTKNDQLFDITSKGSNTTIQAKNTESWICQWSGLMGINLLVCENNTHYDEYDDDQSIDTNRNIGDRGVSSR